MDGIGVPIVGALVGVALFLTCIATQKFRRFALPALVSPFASSAVFIVGSFILADNPAAEYGSEYAPKGGEHDPTTGDIALWLVSVIATFLLSAFASVQLQRVTTGIVGSVGFFGSARTPRRPVK